MFNRNKVLKILNILPEEATLVFFTFLFAFFLGMSLNFMYSVPLSLFLTRYSAAWLPYIYIAAGITTLIISLGYAILEKKVSVFHVLSIPMAILAASLFIFWVVLVTTDIFWIYVPLLIWSWVVDLMLYGVLGVLFNQLFTLQQGKRLFGLMAGGIALGGIIAGFGLDFLVNTIGPHQVILLTAILLMFALFDQFMIKKHAGKRLSGTEEPESERQPSFSFKAFQNKGYVLTVFLFTSLIYFMFFSFDFLFNTQVEQHFTNELEMATFFGIIYACYDFFTLLAGFFLSSWVLHHFGLIVSLTFLPGVVGILLIVAFFTNLIPAALLLVFPILVATGIIENILRESIHGESVLLLFQPLRPAQRAWAQMKNEVSVKPIAMVIIGSFLLLFTYFFQAKVSNMSLVIIVMCVLAVSLVACIIKNGYHKLLVEALSKRSIINPHFTKLDKESLGILKERLKSQYPEEVIYVLQTIEGIDKEEFINTVLETLNHPLDEVRSYSLKKVEEYRIIAAKDKVTQLCMSEKNRQVLGNAFLALGAIGDANSFSFLQQHIDDQDLELASTSIIALIKYGTGAAKEKASQHIVEKVRSHVVEERIAAANVLKEIEIPNKIELLLSLLKDEHANVRAAACRASSNLSDDRLYTPIVENLSSPHVNNAAFLSLLSMGNPFVAYILPNFDRFSEQLKVEIVKILGFMKTEQASEFLKKLLANPNRRILFPALHALLKHSYRADLPESGQQIRTLLKRENENILHLGEKLKVFCQGNTEVLQALIKREIELCQRACFDMLSFIYPEESIAKARSGIVTEDEDIVSYAIELLLQTLSPEDIKHLLPQLSFQAVEKTAHEKGNVEKELVNIFNPPSPYALTSLFSAAVYTIGDLKLRDLANVVREQEGNRDDPYLPEIIPWALNELR